MNNNPKQARLIEERLFLLEKFGPLLFFLAPLVMLIVAGKEWVVYVAFLCQILAVLYIGVFYTVRKQYLAFNAEYIKWFPQRFYRIAWVFVIFIAIVEVVLFLRLI